MQEVFVKSELEVVPSEELQKAVAAELKANATKTEEEDEKDKEKFRAIINENT